MSNNSPGAMLHVVIVIAGLLGIVFPPLLLIAIFIGFFVYVAKKNNWYPCFSEQPFFCGIFFLIISD